MNAIEVDAARKEFVVRKRTGRFGRTRSTVVAVDDVSFAVPGGQILGYIGPNGAGKSTTVKMLTGILVPTSGRVSVAGLDPSRARIELTRKIGVVFGQRTQLWWDLPLRDSFELLRHIYRVPEARFRENLGAFADLLDLEPFMDTPVRQLSLGQRMRGDLTAAMLHDPQIVFLDEPTVGLDVVAKAKVREFLLRMNAERGVTILLTTHDLSDIERLCSRMMIIDHGRVIYDGGVAEIAKRYGERRTLVVDLEEARPALEIPGAMVVKVDGPRQWLTFDTGVSAPDLIAAVAQRARLVDLSIEEPDIEQIVRRIYTEGPGGPIS